MRPSLRFTARPIYQPHKHSGEETCQNHVLTVRPRASAVSNASATSKHVLTAYPMASAVSNASATSTN
ncbi:hypothetical protein KSF_036900 [Reticulibacter mediterranei]|uniref:Uncharacterized protein n=1 Tax=Reticulibacter mediterranei TaxID=2778369 RepID=A0A8J3ILV9_9CHLR|nr:hypothetical protein KSF_036900 [Reticulibacter mediterranei]